MTTLGWRTRATETVSTTRAIDGIAQPILRHDPADGLLTRCASFGCELEELLCIAEEDDQ